MGFDGSIREGVDVWDGRAKRQARADVAGFRWPAHAKADDGEDMIGKIEEVVDQRAVVADAADRTTAKPDALGRIDKRLHRDAGIDHKIEEGSRWSFSNGLSRD